MANSEWKRISIRYSLFAIRYLPRYTSITRSFNDT